MAPEAVFSRPGVAVVHYQGCSTTCGHSPRQVAGDGAALRTDLDRSCICSSAACHLAGNKKYIADPMFVVKVGGPVHTMCRFTRRRMYRQMHLSPPGQVLQRKYTAKSRGSCRCKDGGDRHWLQCYKAGAIGQARAVTGPRMKAAGIGLGVTGQVLQGKITSTG